MSLELAYAFGKLLSENLVPLIVQRTLSHPGQVRSRCSTFATVLVGLSELL